MGGRSRTDAGRAPRRDRRRRPRRGASVATPLALIAGLALLGLRGLEAEVHEEGFGWIDPATLAPIALPEWADPRWSAELEAAVRELPAFPAGDPVGLAAVEACLARLSFVQEVRAARILWPDTLELDLDLRSPVACVPRGRTFLTVAADGTLLSGPWNVPPRRFDGGGFLPVLGSREDAELFARAAPGDYLAEDDHVAALDVAVSLQAHLDPEERERLGRCRIAASSSSPGEVRLELPEGRLCLFGRPPWADAPGELPAAWKWRSLARALPLVDDPTTDWRLVDVRWDRPELVPSRPELLAVAPAPAPVGDPPLALPAGALRGGKGDRVDGWNDGGSSPGPSPVGGAAPMPGTRRGRVL